MNKRILIITQYYMMGGLETYINTQVNDLVKNGYQVHLMCNSIANPAALPAGLSSCYENINFNIGTVGQLVSSINLIREIIQEKKIDIVHVHPFDCIFPTVIAADCEKTPVLLTLHGPLSLQHFTRNIYQQTLSIYFLKTLHTIFCVSQEVAELLTEIIDHPSVQILPNLINNISKIQSVNAIEPENNKNWLIASRLDSDKSAGIIAFIDFASRCDSIERIDIYGVGNDEEAIKQYIVEKGFSSWVHFKGFVNDIPNVMANYAGFAGMGRGVLEAAFCNIPVCLVGYDGIKGVLNTEKFEQAAYCNFSGRNLPNIDEQDLQKEILSVAALPSDLLHGYRSSGRWSKILSNINLPDDYNNTDSLLLYHLLSEAAQSQEDEIYYQSTIFTSIIFKTVANKLAERSTSVDSYYSNIKKRIEMDNKYRIDNSIQKVTHAITSSEDTVIKKLNKLEEQNLSLQSDIKSLTQVLASVIEKQDAYLKVLNQPKSPTRLQRLRYLAKLSAQSLIKADKRYELAKSIYWKLPEYLRVKLHSQRHLYVQKHFQHRCNAANFDIPADEKLPEWVLEINQADKVVFIPCSFEFDELVNQRPINAAKYFADKGYHVVFIAWQWTPEEQLKKGCSKVWQNVYQVPLYDFVKFTKHCNVNNKISFFIVTMPAKVFMPAIYSFRSNGCNIVYDIMDEWECFHKVGQAPWYQKEIEEAIILQSDYVCGVAPSLRKKFAHLRSDIEVIGNGYSEKVLGDTRDIALRGSKKVGYFGHLTDSWFDWDVIFKLSEEFPQYHFEIIGYGEPEWVVEKVKNITNITLVGKVMPKDLHQYVKQWSIGLIPFKRGELAQAVDPIKIYEYLYFGLPTFVTGIEHIKRYPMTYFADENNISEAFVKTIHSARDPVVLDQFLKETTWSARFEKIELDTLNKKGIREFYAS